MAYAGSTSLPASTIYDDKLRLAALSTSYNNDPPAYTSSASSKRRLYIIIAFVLFAVLVVAVSISAIIYTVSSSTIFSKYSTSFSAPSNTVLLSASPTSIRTSFLPVQQRTEYRSRAIFLSLVAVFLVLIAAILAYFMLNTEGADVSMKHSVEEAGFVTLGMDTYEELREESLFSNPLHIAIAVISVVILFVLAFLFYRHFPKNICSPKVQVLLVDQSRSPKSSLIRLPPTVREFKALHAGPEAEQGWDEYHFVQNEKLLGDDDHFYSEGTLFLLHRSLKPDGKDPTLDHMLNICAQCE